MLEMTGRKGGEKAREVFQLLNEGYKRDMKV